MTSLRTSTDILSLEVSKRYAGICVHTSILVQ